MVVIIFLLFLKLSFRFLVLYPLEFLFGTTGVQFHHLCKEKIEIGHHIIVLFTDVLCNLAKSCIPITTAKKRRRNAISFSLTGIVKDAMKARKVSYMAHKFQSLVKLNFLVLYLTQKFLLNPRIYFLEKQMYQVAGSYKVFI